MSREWKPGDVLVVRGEVALVTTSSPASDVGLYVQTARARCLNMDEIPSDAHPLVVIDPEDREQVEWLILAFPDAVDWGFASADDYDNPDSLAVGEGIVEPFQNALRKFANPTPPKPEEPTGLGAVVEDAGGVVWCQVNTTGLMWQRADNRSIWSRWGDIAAVRVLSEGVTP